MDAIRAYRVYQDAASLAVAVNAWSFGRTLTISAANVATGSIPSKSFNLTKTCSGGPYYYLCVYLVCLVTDLWDISYIDWGDVLGKVTLNVNGRHTDSICGSCHDRQQLLTVQRSLGLLLRKL